MIATSFAARLETTAEVDKAIDSFRAFVSMLASLDATLAGFLSAAAALLYAVANTQLSIALRKSGHHRRIVIDLLVGMAMFIIGMLVATLAAFPVNDWSLKTVRHLMSVACGSSAAATFMLLPIGHAFWLLLSRIDHLEDSTTSPYDDTPLKF